MAAACALAIISGKNIFNRAMPERLRTLRHCIFTRRGRKGKRQLPYLLPAEVAARREHPFRLLTSLAATFPKGTALAVAGNFAVAAQRRPLGGAAERSEAEGVFRNYFFPQTLFLHKVPTFRPNYQKKPDFL